MEQLNKLEAYVKKYMPYIMLSILILICILTLIIMNKLLLIEHIVNSIKENKTKTMTYESMFGK